MSNQDTTLPPLPEPAFKRVCLKYAGGDTPGLYREGWIIVDLDAFSADQMMAAIAAQAPQALESIEQYRLQMACISTAAIGYWKVGDGIHPDYDTLALRDVAKLYAKFDALYKAQQAQGVPAGYKLLEDGKTAIPEGWTWCRIEHEPGYPEDVAFGPERMMSRLKKWLDAHFANLAAAPQPEREPIPRVLFDGFAVLQALEPKAKARTSAENVSDVLDAVVKIMRAGACKCKGTGWVCENHDSKPWGDGPGECKCGAGKPCPCNPAARVEWDSVIASSEQSAAGIGTKGGDKPWPSCT